MAINWAVIEADLLHHVYIESVQHGPNIISVTVESLQSKSSFSNELVITAIKNLDEKHLIKVDPNFYELIITEEGKRFVKDAIQKSLG